MNCPECREGPLVVRILALDSYLCCLACHYVNGPIPAAADPGSDVAFA